MLLLKRHLVELVRRGKKRQTIRLWSRPMLRAGQISYTPGLGKMKITAIDELPGLKALTEADAIADGFDSLAALRAEIQKIYGNASQIGTRTLYRIKFEWPIDDAGKKLVINPPSPSQAVKPAEDSEIRNKKKTAVPARNKSAMTARQRELLRAFVVSKHPRSSPI